MAQFTRAELGSSATPPATTHFRLVRRRGRSGRFAGERARGGRGPQSPQAVAPLTWSPLTGFFSRAPRAGPLVSRPAAAKPCAPGRLRPLPRRFDFSHPFFSERRSSGGHPLFLHGFSQLVKRKSSRLLVCVGIMRLKAEVKASGDAGLRPMTPSGLSAATSFFRPARRRPRAHLWLSAPGRLTRAA